MMDYRAVKCQICGIGLPNKWAVARREVVDGHERYYCHLHAAVARNNENKNEKGVSMTVTEQAERSGQEQEIVRNATGERVKKAMTECSSLAAKLGGGVKALWAKVHPDRSPEAMLASMNGSLAENRRRLDEVKPELDRVYAEIVAKKKVYQAASPVRQRLLKVELQTLMARYQGFEREFSILCENERSLETVKSRFLEVLAYGLRGKLDADTVDRLADDLEGKAEDAEDVQDALADLDRAGARKSRSSDDFDAALEGFEGDLGMNDAQVDDISETKEKNNEHDNQNAGAVRDDGIVA